MFGISASRDHPFEYFRRQLRRWPLGFPHCPVTVQITFSSVKLRLSLSAVDCFCASCHEAVLQSVDVEYLMRPKIVCTSLETRFRAFYTF